MRVFQILILTFGLVILADILGNVTAQNNSNLSNSNTASNRYFNSDSNRHIGNLDANGLPIRTTSNSNTFVQIKPNPTPDNDDDELSAPIVLKQITQAKTVDFPQNGEVKVEVVQEVNRPFTIIFTDSGTEKTIGSFSMRNPNGGYISEYLDSHIDPKVRFKVIGIESIASPVIHLMIVQPGGSDYGFWSALFGEVNGKIKLLTPITTQFSWEGGVQIGNLGKGNGTGVAIWNSIWGDGESHYGDHIYQVDFYNFNKKLGKFIKTKTVKTKQKQETPAKALESLGLGFYKDAARDFPEFLEYRENF